LKMGDRREKSAFRTLKRFLSDLVPRERFEMADKPDRNAVWRFIDGF
jgi:hypothetical protein